MIDWKPIAELPDELKDGREVLLGELGAEGFSAKTGWWDDGSWRLFEPYADDWAWTHFAEITEPEPTKPTA